MATLEAVRPVLEAKGPPQAAEQELAAALALARELRYL
jgi:hypothetical protein